MASELEVGFHMRFAKSGAELAPGDVTDMVNVSGTECLSHVQLIDKTVETTVYLGADIATPGWIRVQNLDPTNYITLRSISGNASSAFCKLLAGESAMFRMAGTGLYAIANTDSCRMAVWLVEA